MDGWKDGLDQTAMAPRTEKKLIAKQLAGLPTGLHADGGGLYLAVDAAGARRWIWRYRLGDRRRDMGLGAYPSASLAEARAERDRWRAVLAEGRDPIEVRSRPAPVAAATPTFGEVADEYLRGREGAWRNAKHAAQWKMTLEVYAKPLRAKPVDKIATADVLAVLKPIWRTKAETASRLRGRIETVLDAARVLGHIEESKANPARWRGHLDKLLIRRSKHDKSHHAAMPFAEVPAFVADLRATDAMSARALEFTILTAARTGEVIGATWAEIDIAEKIWTVPADRMKARRAHRVPLVPRALDILAEVREARPDAKHVFAGPRDAPLSNMAMEMLLRRRELEITVHGFRSSFSDWRGETTSYPKELAEAALAHVIGDKTEAAYRRGDALDRRRELMQAWANFIDAPASANVVPLRRPATR